MGLRRSPRSEATIIIKDTNIDSKRYDQYKSKYDYYMLEISKKNKKVYTTADELYGTIMYVKLRTPLSISHDAYELGFKYQQLHVHLIGRVPKGFRYGRYTKYKEFHIRWTKIYDYVGAINYTIKDKHKEHQVQDLNYYRHVYGFV